MPSFAVIDFETTGFSPANGDRVIEVGVVLLGEDGGREGEWDTLLNPLRDVGASWVHGIGDDDVAQAPEFGDVAGVLSELLGGRVLVAHNLPFEARFLDGEYRRLGHELRIHSASGLCTQRLAKRYAPGPKVTLQACCERCGIDQRNAHCALDDARATAELLRHYLEREPAPESAWADGQRESLAISWPLVRGRGWTVSRARG
jgi:DNA polymerase III epsilon subunit family exonuclease